VEVIRNGVDKHREVYQPQRSQPHSTTGNPTISSIADELARLAKLKEQGVISEAEFQQMKQDLIKRM
jgi:K+/H+ antiporter YhaU regulatory subunit KhtT